MVAPYAVVWRTAKPGAGRFAQRWQRGVSWGYLILLSVLASTVEEIWRAYCLMAFQPLGQVSAIAIPSVAFGLAHASSPVRATLTTLFSVYACWLFLRFGSLDVPVVAHFVLNIGMFAMVRTSAARFAHTSRATTGSDRSPR